MPCGIVYIVGAGPGDYKLITLKALECIQCADVLVYDRLADERLLSYAPVQTERVYVGKAASDHTLRQEAINRLLVDKARAGKRVVRLKGGDPFVFGRGGEEILALVEHDVPFEVVPGVTSAIAVPAYAGIPVTHRGLAASFAVITGHEDPAKAESTIRWDKLATAVDTLVFLMGMENLPLITTKLQEHGRSADTPAAVIRWGSKPAQRTLVTTVGQAVADIAEAGLTPPAVFIVGAVVKLRETLSWFERKPLFGKTVLVTRASEQAGALTERLEKLGAVCIEAPAIRIQPPDSYEALDAAITRLRDYQWLIFTSVNGVQYFFERLQAGGFDARSLYGLRIAAIGSPTARALADRGIRADVVPLEFRAEGIVKAMSAMVQTGMKVLLPRAAAAREVLPQQLRALGATVDVITAYRTVTADTDRQAIIEQLRAGRIDVVTFTSSSTVTGLLSLLGAGGAALLQQTKNACIGPITAAACRENGITPAVLAEEYTIQGLTEAIRTVYAGV